MAKNRFRQNVSIWIIISVIVALAVTLAFMASTHLRRQQQQAVEMMTDKGATLINTFAAALRNPAYFKGDFFSLQKLVMETARQPDIDYIIVTEGSGNIIADSDPSSIGDRYGMDLDIGRIASSDEIRWRQVANTGGADTFEVYRGIFLSPEKTRPDIDSRRPGKNPAADNLIIYTGFNMEAIDKATSADATNTIIIALILSLIGSSVIVSLFLAQAWRQASSSLSRITVFSETLVKNMPIGLIAEDESGHIAACNEKAGAILNIACSDIADRKADSVLPASLREMLASLHGSGGLVEKDLLLTLQGENKILEAVAADIAVEGIAAGRMLLLRDVTKIRRLESEVVKSRHLNSIGSLAAGVAHEIRNPLSSLKGFAVYFKERLAGNDEDEKTADVMIQETERVNRVVSQLIEFARPLELKKEKAQMADLVAHTVSLIAAAGDNKTAITIDAAPDLPEADVDHDKVKQALLNVLLNSLAALPPVGSIAVKITADKNDIFVTVADTGSGISKSDLPRIYDPYFTSKPAGTGLGLAIVQKIMEAHGGAIAVESEAGAGTVVTLRFPRKNILA